MESEKWSEIEHCVQDADIFSTQVLHAYKLMAEMDLKSIEAGSKLIISSIQQLPIYVKDCHQLQEDVVEFEEWAKIFLNPSSLKATIKANMVKHLPILTIDLKKVKSDLAKGEFFKAGVQLGGMVVILTTSEAALTDEFWNELVILQ